LKDSWEIAEQGRAERAKKARKKHLLTVKREKGDTLTEEEEKILKEHRERKTTTSGVVEEVKKVDPKAKGIIKVDPKKKDVQPTQVATVPVNTLDLSKPVPNIEQHSSKYIKDFLHYCYQERKIVVDNSFLETKSSLLHKSIMSKEMKEMIIENNIKEFEESEKHRNMENEEYNYKKNSLVDSLKELLKETIVYRKEIKMEREEIIKSRDMLKSKQTLNKDMEKKLHEIINEMYDINTAVQVFKDVKNNGFEDNDLIEKAFNYINIKKEEQYRNDMKKITPKDKQNAQKILDEIKLLSLKISEDITKKLNEIIGI
jgi:hypothetical protein